NTASGAAALQGNTTGNNNVALGYFAGSKLSKGGNNIDIGANVVGLTGEANTIRIGKQGTQKSTVIAGIFGTAVSGSTVVVNSSLQWRNSRRKFRLSPQALKSSLRKSRSYQSNQTCAASARQ